MPKLTREELLRALVIGHDNSHGPLGGPHTTDMALHIPEDVMERYNAACYGLERILINGGSPEERQAAEAAAAEVRARRPPPEPAELTQAIIEEVASAHWQMGCGQCHNGVVYLNAAPKEFLEEALKLGCETAEDALKKAGMLQ
jgi:hypothetical protein